MLMLIYFFASVICYLLRACVKTSGNIMAEADGREGDVSAYVCRSHGRKVRQRKKYTQLTYAFFSLTLRSRLRQM